METKEVHENNNSSGSGSDQLSFGKYLKQARIEKGMSVVDILNQTRISKYVIEQIEDENREKLPEEVFLKGFLKAYAEAVNLDPDDVLQRYHTYCGKKVKSASSSDSLSSDRAGNIKKLYIGIVIGLAVILVVVASLSDNDTNGNVPEANSHLDSSSESVVPAMEETVATPKAVTDKKQKEMLLEIVCVEDTTLKISSDGGKPSEYILKPEDHLEIKAKNKYNILIGNTCGVTLFLNNETVNIPGKCGQTVNLQLP